MPLVTERLALRPSLLAAGSSWRKPVRMDTTAGLVSDVISALSVTNAERLLYAEGDSWFDKFTPIPLTGTNLLDALLTPFASAVVDVSHIGDEARDMVRGPQARQTQAMFKLFSFDAILLSAGGNDLKNVFADLFTHQARARAGLASAYPPQQLQRLADPASLGELFDGVIDSIRRFVALRDEAGDARTRQAPIFVHGYDHFQPRPAAAEIFAGTRVGEGPWLYPALHDAGLDDAQMKQAADQVIDELNRRLQQDIAPLPKVFVLEQRGLLTSAPPGSTGPEGDWMDEIHPSAQGFTRLARQRWDVPLAKALGWVPAAGELVPAA